MPCKPVTMVTMGTVNTVMGNQRVGMALGAGLLWLADSLLQVIILICIQAAHKTHLFSTLLTQTALAGVLEEWTQLWGRSLHTPPLSTDL